MPNILPISDLRNYSAVLDQVVPGSPVYLTRNGRGCYTIVESGEQESQARKAFEYDRMKAQLRLMTELMEGMRSGVEGGWVPEEDVIRHFAEKEYTV